MKKVFPIKAISSSIYGSEKDSGCRDNCVAEVCRFFSVVDPVVKDSFRITSTAEGKPSTVVLRDEISNYNYSAGRTTIARFVNREDRGGTVITFSNDGLVLNDRQKTADGTNSTRAIFEYN